MLLPGLHCCPVTKPIPSASGKDQSFISEEHLLTSLDGYQVGVHVVTVVVRHTQDFLYIYMCMYVYFLSGWLQSSPDPPERPLISV